MAEMLTPEEYNRRADMDAGRAEAMPAVLNLLHKLADAKRDSAEWKEQHENLLAMFQAAEQRAIKAESALRAHAGQGEAVRYERKFLGFWVACNKEFYDQRIDLPGIEFRALYEALAGQVPVPRPAHWRALTGQREITPHYKSLADFDTAMDSLQAAPAVREAQPEVQHAMSNANLQGEYRGQTQETPLGRAVRIARGNSGPPKESTTFAAPLPPASGDEATPEKLGIDDYHPALDYVPSSEIRRLNQKIAENNGVLKMATNVLAAPLPPAQHPEETCERCGGRNVCWFAPNEIWNKFAGESDIICPLCFVGLAEQQGEKAAWVLQPEALPNGDEALADELEQAYANHPSFMESRLRRAIDASIAALRELRSSREEGRSAGVKQALIAASECKVQDVPAAEFADLGAETIYTFWHAAGVLSATDAIRRSLLPDAKP